MKILLISNDKEKTEKLNSFLLKNNYDTIIYRWLLKALDNIEEISPDFCIVNVSDYPRHWKIITQFINQTSLRNKCNVILSISEKLSEDDKKKANALKIAGIFNFSNNEDFNNLLDLLKNPKENETEKTPPTNKNIEYKPTGKKSLLAKIEALYDK